MSSPPRQAFLQGLRDLGYVEGETIIIEVRASENRAERLPALAAELVSLPVDVIVASSTDTARAAGQATQTIPIVAPSMANPVGSGVIASLARPGGNITGGTSDVAGDLLPGKRLSLLRETIAPRSRVAALYSSTYSPVQIVFAETQRVAPGLGVTLFSPDVRTLAEVEAFFRDARSWGAEALINLGGPFIDSLTPRIIELTADAGLPAMHPRREWTDAGGLMAYGIDFRDQYRRGAAYVDKILKGAKPADLPVQQPDTFDFIVNLKAAQALGVTIPQAILQQASEIIQ